MKRKNGYYWVSDEEGIYWSIAEWVSDGWFEFGHQIMRRPDYFKKVDENEIVRLPKTKVTIDPNIILTSEELSSLKEVIRISDRLHPAWDKVKEAIKKVTE